MVEKRPLLTVIIPVFNERSTIREIISRVQAVPISKQIIVVDDGSTDGTTELLREISDSSVKVLFHADNRGKGAAIRTALPHAEGKVTVIQDGDLEYDPMDFLKLIQPILRGEADVVYGSRWHKGAGVSYKRYLLGGRLLSAIVGILYGGRIDDEPVCYKMFRTEILKRLDLKCKGFDFCPEVTAKVLRLGYKIHQLPIRYMPRSFEEGKKICWKDGLFGIWTLIKWRVMPFGAKGKGGKTVRRRGELSPPP